MSESKWREALATVSDAHYPVRGEAAGGGLLVRVCRCGDVWTPDHLADALSPVLAQMKREWQAEALREAADEVEHVERVGQTPANEIAADEREWFGAHPLRNVDGYQRHRPVVAQWLRDRAEASGQEGT